MEYGNREITVADVAKMLVVSERHAEALLKGRLIAGRQLRSGVWLTSRSSVERYRATSNRGSGRALSKATAWGLLWELSGMRATWLSSSTRARVLHQIETLSPEEIVRATSGRTRARYYSFAGTGDDVSWDGLIRTGRPAARRFGVRTKRVLNHASGYVRDGAVADYARQRTILEDYEGKSVLFENTLPIRYTRAVMPDAVVAVDLALSGADYEVWRSARIIAQLQNEWREARRGI